MFTCEQLKDSLEEISASAAEPNMIDRVECVKFNPILFHDSGHKYEAEVVIRMTCHYEFKGKDRNRNYLYATEWIKRFSTFTNTSWVLCPRMREFKRLPRECNIYYKCHSKCFSTQKNVCSYSQVCENIKKLLGGPPDCQSNIAFKFTDRVHESSFKIKITIGNLYCKRLHMQNYFLALASGDKSWILKYLDGLPGPSPDCSEPSVSIDEVYYRYFTGGHTCITAKLLHLLIQLFKYGNNDNMLSNPTKNPTMSYVTSIYRLYRTYKKADCINLEVIMSRKQAEIEELGGLMRFHSSDMVTILTPTMKRVLSCNELDEVIISSTEVNQGPTVTLFYIPSKVGALCFGCVLHQEKTQQVYSNVFSNVKCIIEKDCSKIFKPKRVIVDISKKLSVISLGVKIVFQDSKVLIAPWSLCYHAWNWICASAISYKKYWHEAMAGFHNIMYAADTKSASVCYKKFMSKIKFSKLRFFKPHLVEIWKEYKNTIWRSSANNPLIGLSITLLQQLFHQKCLSINIIQMCDIIGTLDKYFQQILLRWVHKNRPVLKFHSTHLEKCELNALKLEITTPREFSIDIGSLIKLRTDTWRCDCITGRKGLFCEHLCTFIKIADVSIALSVDEICMLKHIAGENNDTAADADGNCEEANKAHPTYTDGFYLFNLPININLVFTHNWKAIDLSLSGRESYKLIINDVIQKYKSMTGLSDYVQEEDKDVNMTVKRKSESSKEEDKQVTHTDVVEKLDKFESQKCVKRRKISHVEDGQIERKINTDSVDIPNTDTPKESDSQKNKNESEIYLRIKEENEESVNGETYNMFEELPTTVEEPHTQNSEIDIKKFIYCSENDILSKETLNTEIDLKVEEIVCSVDNESKNSLEEQMSENFIDANSNVNNFEDQYNKALDTLRNEFKKLRDGLWVNPSSNKLGCVVRLTQELRKTRAELLEIKCEPDDTVD